MMLKLEDTEKYYDTLDKVRRDEEEAYRQIELLYDQIRTLDTLKPKALQRAGQTGKLVKDLLDRIRDYHYARTKKQQVENI